MLPPNFVADAKIIYRYKFVAPLILHTVLIKAVRMCNEKCNLFFKKFLLQVAYFDL